MSHQICCIYFETRKRFLGTLNPQLFLTLKVSEKSLDAHIQ